MNMKRLITVAAVGILASTAPAPGVADGLSGDASLGASYSGRDQNSAKFREYWYDMHSMFALAPEAHVRYEFPSGGDQYFIAGSMDGRTGLADRSNDG